MRVGVQRLQKLLVTNERALWRYDNAFLFTNKPEVDFGIATYFVTLKCQVCLLHQFARTLQSLTDIKWKFPVPNVRYKMSGTTCSVPNVRYQMFAQNRLQCGKYSRHSLTLRWVGRHIPNNFRKGLKHRI